MIFRTISNELCGVSLFFLASEDSCIEIIKVLKFMSIECIIEKIYIQQL
jgi:hypothetical protein